MRIIIAFLVAGIGGTVAALFTQFFEMEEKKPLKTIQTYAYDPLIQADKFTKFDKQYCINYGNENAPVKIVEFFSFQCPHCIKLFNDDFKRIKENFVDTGKVYFKFHPVPQDLPTVQAMICLEKLEENEKRLFLEVLFEEAVPSDPELMSKLMMTAMNVFKKPLSNLDDHHFLENHQVFEKIYPFLKQEKILAVPTVEIDGQLFAKEIPSYQFIKTFTRN